MTVLLRPASRPQRWSRLGSVAFLANLGFVSVVARERRLHHVGTVIEDLLEAYNKDEMPEERNEQGQLLRPLVQVGLRVNKLLDVNIHEGSFKVSVWKRLTWWDPRLQFNGTELFPEYRAVEPQNMCSGPPPQVQDAPGCVRHNTNRVLSQGWDPESSSLPFPSDRLWIPDIELDTQISGFVENCRPQHASVFDINEAMSLERNGKMKYNVFLSTPCELTAKCRFDLRKFPFDSSICPINFLAWTNTQVLFRQDPGTSSFSGITEEFLVVLRTSEKVVKHAPCEEGGCMDISCGCHADDPDGLNVTIIEGIVAEDIWYPKAGQGGVRCPTVFYNLRLTRFAHYYVTNFILPMMTMIMLSWLTFFIPLDMGDRLAYSITIMLNAMALNLLTADKRPAVKTSMWLDQFQTTAFIFVFVPTIETVVLQRIMNIYEKDAASEDSLSQAKLMLIASRVDRYFRVIYPAFMALVGFCLICPIRNRSHGLNDWNATPALYYRSFFGIVFTAMVIFAMIGLFRYGRHLLASALIWRQENHEGSRWNSKTSTRLRHSLR